MKTYNTIQELMDDLGIKRKPISPNFNIYKYSELSNPEVKKEIFEPHRKRFFSINFHVKNVTARRIGYTYFEKLDKSINFNSPMQPFSIHGEKSVGSEGFGVFFTSDFFKPYKHRFDIIREFPFFKLNTLPYFKLKKELFNNINDLLEEIHLEYTNNAPYNMEIIHSQLIILLHRIKRIKSDKYQTIELSRAEEITNNFEDLIIKEINSNKTLREYAEKLFISAIYLSECVKKSTGQSAKKVIIDYKLLQAKAMLKSSNEPISRIATSMGYSETTNFIKFFKEHQGVTPLVYRKN
ncbi:AraC family transcriptional regulator [uncultured Aquimarina sp.]|uniref:helix-turn-helix domain-containing protein n=1 Tax=uncultured Aquimarina sp. TaxID=575652 RepID=UPI00261227E2|nr:AraC family transcriptional regulator [uncultured Aquimarina sp.]